jgi:hypothetical protein
VNIGFEPLRLHQHIIINPYHQLAARRLNCGIACVGMPLSGFENASYWKPMSIQLDHRTGVIGTVVIHDQQFPSYIRWNAQFEQAL